MAATPSKSTSPTKQTTATIGDAPGLPIDYKSYAAKIGEKESGGKYDTVHSIGSVGKYQVGAMAYFYAASFGYGRIYIYKNGSNALETEQPPRTSGSASPAFTHLIAMNGSTDYLEVYVRMDAAGTVGDGIVANNFYAFWTRSL